MSNNGQTGTAVAPAPKPPLVSGGAIAAIVPRDIEQAYRMATIIDKAGMAPKAYAGKPEMIMVAIMHGLEVGFTPMAALQSIAVVNGTPTIWGDGALGLVQASGYLEDISEHIEGEDSNAPIAVCTVKRKGRSSHTQRTFSRVDAQKAGLWAKQGPWAQYPKRMMQMRARSFALRDAFPDVLRGLGIREEVEDTETLERGQDGTYTPSPPRPTRVQLQQAQPEPQPVQTQQPAADDPDAWLISPDSFPSINAFSEEWRRQLDEVCATPEDVDLLIAANVNRLDFWASDRATKAAVGALQADADARRAYLTEAA